MNYYKKVTLSFILVFFSLSIFSAHAQGIRYPKNDTIRMVIKNEIVRFFSASFWSGVEIPVTNRKSVYISGIATYGSPSGRYDQITGWGAEFQYRNYLGKGSFITDRPIYFAYQLMGRRIFEFEENTTPIYTTDQYGYQKITGENYSETKKGYTVFYGGMLIGMQLFINEIFTVDLNFGGGLRLTRMDGSKQFTRYKGITELDYSGVLPRAGFIIGIIHR
ncbi:MAG: hypothetical protein A3H98_01435 [Bacteroidetes bacterium RIFCSPLOWO2_02_FULL_36_8]|nr:MAG: hypothetical protein A3H98_01435 [Bacteroidetes bacterium RIFCSPLOWO2_02_FULL_36_8]OFY70912.1 MAG: hypothetical protein A3G23_12390 [Bacteroidetes bacterium RIFCSPLOWO2_12_FULL_37_12]